MNTTKIHEVRLPELEELAKEKNELNDAIARALDSCGAAGGDNMANLAIGALFDVANDLLILSHAIGNDGIVIDQSQIVDTLWRIICRARGAAEMNLQVVLEKRRQARAAKEPS